MDGVERLSIVSKVLFDSRLCELKRENEELRLRVFWLEHSESKFAELMQLANCSESGPWCSCFACLESGRFHPMYAGPGTDTCRLECAFKPWFEEIVGRCGLSVGMSKEDDTHFWYTLSECSPLCFSWGYGRKLTDVRRSDDCEFCKLEALFVVLGEMV